MCHHPSRQARSAQPERAPTWTDVWRPSIVGLSWRAGICTCLRSGGDCAATWEVAGGAPASVHFAAAADAVPSTPAQPFSAASSAAGAGFGVILVAPFMRSCTCSTPSCEPSTAAVNTMATGLPAASAQSAGPGHSPDMPQPVPKIRAPPTSSRVIARDVGSSNSHVSNGDVRLRIARNTTRLKHTAPARTHARVPSQPTSTGSRKPMTREGCTMPLSARPPANRAPRTALSTTSNEVDSSTSLADVGRAPPRAVTTSSASRPTRLTPNAGQRTKGFGSAGADSAARTPVEPMVVAVTTPMKTKVHTETSERLLRRGRPHTPCPDVQPEPIFVPAPTSTPAMIAVMIDGSTGSAAKSDGTSSATMALHATMPARKPSRHERLLCLSCSELIAVKMPEMPVIRPRRSRLSEAATAIRSPPKRPKSADSSVNLSLRPNVAISRWVVLLVVMRLMRGAPRRVVERRDPSTTSAVSTN
mmetsp:Transcript_17065/g.44114  ORF Transcript_17065/g.44114 Transcript_17065/m.44114 type:complete len:474 (+) Transcript_17065:123-1544(+)